MGGKQRLKRRVASAAFYNETLDVNSVSIQRYLIDARESGELRQGIDAILVGKWEIRRRRPVIPAKAGTQVLHAPRQRRQIGFPPAREVISGNAGNDAAVITWQVIAAPRAARHTGSIVNHRRSLK